MSQKFEGVISSVYCLILVSSRLAIQSCKIEEFSRYD